MKKLIYLLALVFTIALISCVNCDEKLQKVNFEILENNEIIQELNVISDSIYYGFKGLEIELELKQKAFDVQVPKENLVYGKLEYDLNKVLGNLEYNSNKLDSTLLALKGCWGDLEPGASVDEVDASYSCRYLLSSGKNRIENQELNIESLQTRIEEHQKLIESIEDDVYEFNEKLVALNEDRFISLPNISEITYNFAVIWGKLYNSELNLRECNISGDPDFPNKPLFSPKGAFE